MFLEVESNENCETSIFLRFKEAGPARPVIRVKSYEREPKGEWCDVVGYAPDDHNPWPQAMGQVVEDSGAGLAILIYGGLGGVRLKPVSAQEAWNLGSLRQWGETHLLLGDVGDLRYAEEP